MQTQTPRETHLHLCASVFSYLIERVLPSVRVCAEKRFMSVRGNFPSFKNSFLFQKQF